MVNIQPLGGLILFKKIEKTDTSTASGLILTADSLDSDISRGEIVAIGPGDRDQEGKIHSIPLEIGQTVIYSDNQATEVTDKNRNKYYFINWRHLFGVENA